ncbi:MAG: DMT family transporter [Eggerthellaceae bacterium]|nr:DMT family transporter [Eggerthellaceae bacterium]
MSHMQKALPYILVALAATCWGFTGLFNRFITPMGLSQTQMFFMRCLVPTVVLGLWLLAKDRGAFRIRLRDIWMFLGSGLLSLTMFGLAYFSAMQVMPLSVAVVLLYTSPVWVMLFSAPLFKERLHPGV